MEEISMIAVDINDRHGRRLILCANNDQRCVLGCWIEEDSLIQYENTISNVQLYEMVFNYPR